jgi:hypothetical protein
VLSPADSFALYPDVATSDSGRTVVSWTDATHTAAAVVRAALRPKEGPWSAPMALSQPSTVALRSTAVVGPDGRATVAWLHTTGGNDYVQQSTAPAGAAFGRVHNLSSDLNDALDPALSVGSGGDVVTFWVDSLGIANQARYAALDVSGPLLTVTAPATTTQRVPTTFSATARDVWSAVASYAWSFGDGGTATGASPAHTYAAPGIYRIKLRVEDSHGNATKATANITVKQARPVITKFALSKPRIRRTGRTQLKVGAVDAASLRVVLKSKHRHRVHGRSRYVRLVLIGQLKPGLNRITISGSQLLPDAYRVTGRASNGGGISPRRTVRLVVLR